MNTIFQYKDAVERAAIVSQNTDKFLIEEQNIIEGNFLIFTDKKPVYEQFKQSRYHF
jgi:hypothetical protein